MVKIYRTKNNIVMFGGMKLNTICCHKNEYPIGVSLVIYLLFYALMT